jgi:hypothetical protein
MNSFVKTLLGVAVIGLMVGCGGTDDEMKSGLVQFNSSLTDSTVLGTFTQADASKFCNELADWELARANDDLATACKGFAFWSAQTFYDPSKSIADVKAECHNADAECLAGQTITRRDCGTPSYPPECTATVKEAEACSTELIETWKAENAMAPTCDQLTAADLAARPDQNAGPGSACTTVLSKCPTYFDM